MIIHSDTLDPIVIFIAENRLARCEELAHSTACM